MGRLGDREEDGAGEFYGEKDRKKRAGKKDWKRRTGKGGSAERLGRNAQSGETLNREKRSIGRNAQSGEMLRKNDSEKARRQKILCPAESGQHRSGRRNE